MSRRKTSRSRGFFHRLFSAGDDDLPPSNPTGWPFSTAEDLQIRPKRIVKIGLPQMFSFADNNIKTSKYEVHSFLPKFLLEEFNPSTKIANCYFLVIAGLQCIPVVSNTGGIPTTMLPLIVVVTVDALFQIFEDIKRHRADTRANASAAMVFIPEQRSFQPCTWSDIAVGDILKIRNRESVPADVLILSVAPKTDENGNNVQNTGLCYIETKSLDGETNLKLRSAMPLTKNMLSNEQDLSLLKGEIEMEHPNKLIESFNGVLSIQGTTKQSGGREVISPGHILLRGCVLRNTDYIYALVLNTGHDTKIMMSASQTKMKASQLENAASGEITKIIGLLLFLCFWGSTGQAIWNTVNNIDNIRYLQWPSAFQPVSFWFIDFFYFFLLHATFIPVSLYVSMSMARYCQAFFMNRDTDMVDPVTKQPALVRTMTLNEELGQISHVFSDKTGTLTCNNMDFRKMSVGGVAYGQGITEIGKAAWKLLNKPIPVEMLEAEAMAQANSVPHVSFYCKKFNQEVTSLYKNSDNNNINKNNNNNNESAEVEKMKQDQSEKIAYFFRVLAICHDVIPEKLDGGQFHFKNNNNIINSLPNNSNNNNTKNNSKSSLVNVHEVKDIESPQIKYSASNPDDEALVCAAKYFGFEFVDRKDDVVTLINRFAFLHEQLKLSKNETSAITTTYNTTSTDTMVVIPPHYESVKVLVTIPFTSKRKRMSVVIQDPLTNSISILCKGADAVMLPRLKAGQDALIKQTLKHVEEYALEGLRCLFVAAATLRDEDFQRWQEEYSKVSTDMKELEKKNRGDSRNKIEELEDILEQSLFLLGATAIEDKLQVGVPECVAQLVQAGTVIWVLTGDKEETAINIAVACNLLQPTSFMEHIIVNSVVAPNHSEMKKLLEQEIARYDADLVAEDGVFKPRALIIDGASLLMITHEHDQHMNNNTYNNNNNNINNGADSTSNTLSHPKGSAVLSSSSSSSITPTTPNRTDGKGSTLKDLLLALSVRCKAVVGCRVSPDQKKEMVKLVKDNVPLARTLAIGDGANDVAMIQEAHVGIGIKGEEGTQAVNSADYAIGQFRFLGDLMLKHGRYNYIRMSQLVCYMFYKNLFMSMGMFWFNFNNGFSGQKYYTEGAIQLFNLMYTSIPIIWYACCDCDVDKETVRLFPQLYMATVNSEYFSSFVFWSWIFNAFVESILVSVLPLFSLANFHKNSQDSFLFAGATCISAVVIIVNLKMFFIQCQWDRLKFALVSLSVLVFYASLLVISAVKEVDFHFYRVFFVLLSSPHYYLTLLLLVVVVIAKDAYLAGLERSFNFKPVQILQEMEVAEQLPHIQAHADTSANYFNESNNSNNNVNNKTINMNNTTTTNNNVTSVHPSSGSGKKTTSRLVNTNVVQPFSSVVPHHPNNTPASNNSNMNNNMVYMNPPKNAWENNLRTMPTNAFNR